MDEETRIEMEFEDTPGEETEKPETRLTKPEPEKPGIVKRVVGTVTAPFRWIGRKVTESPAAAAIGMVAGTAVGYGVKALIGKVGKHDGFIPADPPEIEIPDDGECYTETSSYESTEE